jgi:hypothetical protein
MSLIIVYKFYLKRENKNLDQKYQGTNKIYCVFINLFYIMLNKLTYIVEIVK